MFRVQTVGERLVHFIDFPESASSRLCYDFKSKQYRILPESSLELNSDLLFFDPKDFTIQPVATKWQWTFELGDSEKHVSILTDFEPDSKNQRPRWHFSSKQIDLVVVDTAFCTRIGKVLWPDGTEKDGQMPEVEEKVNHPKHYNVHPSGVECIQIVEHFNFNIGNAIKYLWRSDHKGAQLEDLKKARFYIEREIERCSKDLKASKPS